MNTQRARSKETDKAWLCAEALFTFEGSKTATIAHRAYYNATATGLTISFIVVPNTLFKINKQAADKGWDILYNGTDIVFTLGNGATIITVSKPIVTVKKSRVMCYYDGITGKIGIIIDGSIGSKIESSSNITGDFNTTTPITISGSNKLALLTIFDKVLSDDDLYLRTEISILPTSLYINCVGFWTMQERYGDKLYDYVVIANTARTYATSLAPNHATLTGYTNAELGITSKVAQTAWVNWYDKVSTDLWRADGLQPFTTMNETLNTVECTNSPTQYITKTDVSIPVGTVELTLFMNLVVDATTTQFPWNLFPSGNTADRLQIRLHTSALGELAWTYLGGTGNTVPSSVIRNGVKLIAINYKVGAGAVSTVSIDGIKRATISASQPNGLVGRNTLRFGQGCKVINAGLVLGSLSTKEMLEMYNNGNPKNPSKETMLRIPYYYSSDAPINSSTKTSPNLGYGGGTDWSFFGSTTADLTPGDASTNIRTINSLK